MKRWPELGEDRFKILEKAESDIVGVIKWDTKGYWKLEGEEGFEIKLEVRKGSGVNFREETTIEYISKDKKASLRADISQYIE